MKHLKYCEIQETHITTNQTLKECIQHNECFANTECPLDEHFKKKFLHYARPSAKPIKKILESVND
jgi:hypothetical protein